MTEERHGSGAAFLLPRGRILAQKSVFSPHVHKNAWVMGLVLTFSPLRQWINKRIDEVPQTG